MAGIAKTGARILALVFRILILVLPLNGWSEVCTDTTLAVSGADTPPNRKVCPTRLVRKSTSPKSLTTTITTMICRIQIFIKDQSHSADLRKDCFTKTILSISSADDEFRNFKLECIIVFFKKFVKKELSNFSTCSPISPSLSSNLAATPCISCIFPPTFNYQRFFCKSAFWRDLLRALNCCLNHDSSVKSGSAEVNTHRSRNAE